ncbi:MAG: AMP-binding protein, partial [bacterium]|nr:AMP-binding protein [bacterium]
MTTANITEASIAAGQSTVEREYWIEQLGSPPEKHYFPYKGRQGDGTRDRTGRISGQIAPDLAAPLLKLVNRSHLRLHMVLLTAATILLERYTYDSGKDIIIGTPVYKQEIKGKFVNTTLPLRHKIKPGMTFKELLLHVRETITQASKHQNYPIETMLYHLNLSNDEKKDFPLFDTVIILENIHDKTYLEGININTLFIFKHSEETIQYEVEYNSGRYTPEAIEAIVTHLESILRQGVTGINREIATLELLTETGKEQQLYEFNDTQREYPLDKTVVTLFEEQAQKTPHREAVVGMKRPPSGQDTGIDMEREAITYGELNRQSEQVAQRLREKGVKPGMLVAILEEPTVEMIRAILAVLKAGAAYLPIDPQTPQQRILYMLEDSAVHHLLTGRAVIETQSFSRLQGLHRTQARPHVTAPRPAVADLDTLPIPDRTLIDYEKYTRHISLAMVKNCITLQGTRGCPYECAYCARLWPKKHVARTAENIFAEVKKYYDKGVRRFALIDDIFNLKIENSSRFYELIIENNMEIQLLFPAGLRGDIMTPEYIDLMVKAGTVNISLALETASPRLQKLMRKNLDIEKLRRNLQYICTKHPHVI